MSADRPRVLFIDRPPSSAFLTLDRLALEASFDVVVVEYPGSITKRFAWECLRQVRRVDAVYTFFASEHSVVPALLARLFRRRFVLVPAGYDYARLPDKRYGLATQGKGLVPRLVGRAAHAALPISQLSMWEFLSMVPGASARTRLGHLALDPGQWEAPGVERDLDQVVTFGYIDQEAFGRKGIDRFVAAASRDPQRRYVLAGRLSDDVQARIDRERPANLSTPGRLEHDELRRLLWSSGVYAQLSWHETFGVAMAEAMLCGCVPVVSDSHALNEVAGRWAVPSAGPDDDVAAINRGVAAAGHVDRERMRLDLGTRFSFERRVETLRRAVAAEDR